MSLLTHHRGIIVCCLIFFVLCLLRLNDRSILTPDSCQYIIWGNSLAHGNGFTDSTHPLPDSFVNHGPLYPLLIAPIEAIFPLSVRAVKVWTAFFGVATLIFLYLFLLIFFSKRTALLGTVFFASNPLLLIYSTEALSDIPFIAFTLASLYLFFRQQHDEKRTNAQRILFLVVTLCVPLLREIGLGLIIAYIAYYALRREWKEALFVAGATLLILGLWNIRNNFLVEKTPFSQMGNMPWIIDHVMTAQDASFITELITRIRFNLQAYIEYLLGMMLYPTYAMQQLSVIFSDASQQYHMMKDFFSFGKYVVFVLFLALFVSGILLSFSFSRIRIWLSPKPAMLIPLFLLCYLGILFLFPFNDVRYMMPLVPFFLYFSFLGFQQLRRRYVALQLSHKGNIAFGMVIILLLPNVLGLSDTLGNNFRQNKTPVLAWQDMGSWIAEHTPPGIIIASPLKDLALVLTEDRKVIDIHPTIETPAFEFLLRSFDVEYLLSPTWYETATVFDFQENASTRIGLEHCYSAGGLHLFKVTSLLRQPRDLSLPPLETGTASELLLRAQLLILSEQYDSANVLLANAQQQFPERPDIIYQTLVASCLQEQMEQAERLYQQLTTFTSDVGIYVQSAKKHLALFSELRQAQKLTSKEQQSVQLHTVAMKYWNMGFYRKAYSLMNRLLSTESSYFTGLLWGVHFAVQLADLQTAKAYLIQLETLERVNPLVQAYKTIIETNELLRLTEQDSTRIRLHLQLASLYDSISLTEEALDETERALRYSPKNREAIAYFAQLIEKKGLPQIAAKILKRTF